MTPDWHPDWTGRPAAIIACGPSANKEDAENLRGRVPVIAINRAYELAQWADVLYGCDARFWKIYREALQFPGLKICQDYEFCKENPGIHHVRVEFTNKIVTDPGILGSGGIAGSGGNGGFQALNLAIQFGANPIMLLGYDMSDTSGLHFHGKHPVPLNNPRPDMFDRWRSAFNKSEPGLRQRGIRILNCTPNGTLNMFPKMSVEEALDTLKVDA